MFACMVVASRIPNPLLEMCALNNVGMPVASCNSKLDGDYLWDGLAWLHDSVGVDPLVPP